MAVAANADLYAEPRQNIFFKTIYPSLEGQCVTLVKCFMEDMTGVSNPHAARGDARYVGKTLVAQGYAIEVPYGERKRGDIICYEYGTYGHIAVQLSDGRVFEQNVNLGGVQSKIVYGARVYASRIGSENEAWRHDAHIYRIKSYNEEGNDMKATANDLKYLYLGIYNESVPDAVLAKDPFIGTDLGVAAMKICDYANTTGIAYWQYAPKVQEEIKALKKRIAELEAGGEYIETKVYVKKVG